MIMWKRLVITSAVASFLCFGAGQSLASDAGAVALDAAPAKVLPVAVATEEAPTADPVENVEDKAEAIDPVAVAGKVVADARAGDWRHFASGLLALVMFGLAKYREKVPWFAGDRGGAILVGVLGLGGGLVTALASDSPLDWRLFVGAMATVWTAVGGYTWFKQIWSPRDKKAGAA